MLGGLNTGAGEGGVGVGGEYGSGLTDKLGLCSGIDVTGGGTNDPSGVLVAESDGWLAPAFDQGGASWGELAVSGFSGGDVGVQVEFEGVAGAGDGTGGVGATGSAGSEFGIQVGTGVGVEVELLPVGKLGLLVLSMGRLLLLV